MRYRTIFSTAFFIFTSTMATAKDFNYEEVKSKSDSAKGRTLVFKGFYLGMPASDAQGLINHFMELPHTPSTPVEVNDVEVDQRDNSNAAVDAAIIQTLSSELFQGMTHDQLRSQGFDDQTIEALGIDDPVAPYRVFSRNGQHVISKNRKSRPFAVADSSGNIIKLELSSEIIKKIFGQMPTDQFLQSFINAYGIPELEGRRQKITATVLGEKTEIGFQNIYQFRDKRGYEVIFYADSLIFEEEKASFADTPPSGTMTIQKIETATKIQSRFD